MINYRRFKRKLNEEKGLGKALNDKIKKLIPVKIDSVKHG